jgi:hypothetical protein
MKYTNFIPTRLYEVYQLNTYSPMKVEQTGCSETLALPVQTQKKAYDIKNTAKILNKKYCIFV